MTMTYDPSHPLRSYAPIPSRLIPSRQEVDETAGWAEWQEKLRRGSR